MRRRKIITALALIGALAFGSAGGADAWSGSGAAWITDPDSSRNCSWIVSYTDTVDNRAYAWAQNNPYYGCAVEHPTHVRVLVQFDAWPYAVVGDWQVVGWDQPRAWGPYGPDATGACVQVHWYYGGDSNWGCIGGWT